MSDTVGDRSLKGRSGRRGAGCPPESLRKGPEPRRVF